MKNERTDLLAQAFLSLETVEDCYRFFEDLCTIHELQSLAQRMEVARQLDEKKTYSSIAEDTGASTATISRVSRASSMARTATAECWTASAKMQKTPSRSNHE